MDGRPCAHCIGIFVPLNNFKSHLASCSVSRVPNFIDPEILFELDDSERYIFILKKTDEIVLLVY